MDPLWPSDAFIQPPTQQEDESEKKHTRQILHPEDREPNSIRFCYSGEDGSIADSFGTAVC
ncbi:hypothetical protein K458DRAFT_416711 [Lentithecium fluviatile CBS 122367]|uniref:Uncharacterized protein n=1 Tax=Lentithecium fluviatile CBS 122367 TaxID=1168545 RepID=A0A6G1J7B5_9PLEO|nr:hypothetical protein K458DRAFT_416711 [Lentithecium fluviatile CBS 122367]